MIIIVMMTIRIIIITTPMDVIIMLVFGYINQIWVQYFHRDVSISRSSERNPGRISFSVSKWNNAILDSSQPGHRLQRLTRGRAPWCFRLPGNAFPMLAEVFRNSRVLSNNNLKLCSDCRVMGMSRVHVYFFLRRSPWGWPALGDLALECQLPWLET